MGRVWTRGGRGNSDSRDVFFRETNESKKREVSSTEKRIERKAEFWKGIRDRGVNKSGVFV